MWGKKENISHSIFTGPGRLLPSMVVHCPGARPFHRTTGHSRGRGAHPSQPLLSEEEAGQKQSSPHLATTGVPSQDRARGALSTPMPPCPSFGDWMFIFHWHCGVGMGQGRPPTSHAEVSFTQISQAPTPGEAPAWAGHHVSPVNAAGAGRGWVPEKGGGRETKRQACECRCAINVMCISTLVRSPVNGGLWCHRGPEGDSVLR